MPSTGLSESGAQARSDPYRDDWTSRSHSGPTASVSRPADADSTEPRSVLASSPAFRSSPSRSATARFKTVPDAPVSRMNDNGFRAAGSHRHEHQVVHELHRQFGPHCLALAEASAAMHNWQLPSERRRA